MPTEPDICAAVGEVSPFLLGFSDIGALLCKAERSAVSTGFFFVVAFEVSPFFLSPLLGTAFLVLSHTPDLSFEQVWPAAGLGSDTGGYLDPDETVIVGYRLFP